MSGSLALVSMIALWVIVLFLAVAVVLIYKQMGDLLLQGRTGMERLQGPGVGDRAPAVDAARLPAGERVEYIPTNEFLFFAQPGCPGCDAMGADLPGFASANPDARVTFITSYSDRDMRLANGSFPALSEVVAPAAMLDRLDGSPIRMLAGLNGAEEAPHTRYNVSVSPFTVFVGHDGRVRSKAITSTIEQLRDFVMREDPDLIADEYSSETK